MTDLADYFYRKVRSQYGWLMDGDEPEGGRWNFDKENREPEGAQLPGPSFEDDIPDFVEKEFPDHFRGGDTHSAGVTREQA